MGGIRDNDFFDYVKALMSTLMACKEMCPSSPGSEIMGSG
jgi:hypothetical protein